MSNILARFYGGSWDGETKDGNYGGARTVIVAIGPRFTTREIYERDRSRYERDANGAITTLAYTFLRSEASP